VNAFPKKWLIGVHQQENDKIVFLVEVSAILNFQQVDFSSTVSRPHTSIKEIAKITKRKYLFLFWVFHFLGFMKLIELFFFTFWVCDFVYLTKFTKELKHSHFHRRHHRDRTHSDSGESSNESSTNRHYTHHDNSHSHKGSNISNFTNIYVFEINWQCELLFV
jgi:hypothetical protein